MKKYFFVLGKNPYLSIAEIKSLFSKNDLEIFENKIAFLETEEDIKPQELINKLGGTIKIGEVLGLVKEKGLEKKVLSVLLKKEIKKDQKFKFGFSVYGKKSFNLKALAMKAKKQFKEHGVSSRWVDSNKNKLSSVVVEQNKLIEKGVELNLFFHHGEVLLGQTSAVQNFKDFSFRDYGRPARDDKSGMLPPKLARMMINLASPSQEEVVLDPFCGSGTILTEALLLGYDKLLGSDLSLKAIKDSKENIDWLSKNYKLKPFDLGLYNQDVKKLREKIKDNTIGAIITEPYLGPQRNLQNPKQVKIELEDLYSQALEELFHLLKPNGIIVMIWPVLNLDKLYFLEPEYKKRFKMINPLEDFSFNLSFRNTIIYKRENQKVFREIIILKKEE